MNQNDVNELSVNRGSRNPSLETANLGIRNVSVSHGRLCLSQKLDTESVVALERNCFKICILLTS